MEKKIATRTEAKESFWSDLPSDILNLIESRLLGRDCICFRAVCSTWRSAPSPIHLIPPLTTHSAMIQFPSLMYFGRDNSLSNFFHPIYNSTYTMDVPELAGSIIRFSRDGWLLMSQGNHAMFFFNPFTKERIDLPDLPQECDFIGISFSCTPTSSDCVVLGFEGYTRTWINFSFIRRGEDTWGRCEADNNILDFIPSLSNPFFYDGVFYCLGRNGNLGIFDPKEYHENAWTVLATPKPPCVSIRKNYLAEFNGELVSVFVGHAGKWVSVFKLDRSVMAWQKLKSLGDGMLFVSLTASLSAATTKLRLLGMENKIYIPRFSGKNGVFYSLVTAKFHTLGDGYSRDDYYGTQERMHCTWIEPNFEKHSDEELSW